MNNFEFPTNIKQIGSIEDGLRIYVEDYVCSYLQQYTSAAGYDEKLATLVGKYIIIDNQPVIFISGAIIGKYCILENEIMIFSDKSYDYIIEQIDVYFKGLEIVGWMQSQPGYGTFLNPKYENYHIENFRKSYQVLFVMDPIEKLSSFYVYNKNKDKLLETKGYFIYYEKNHNMQEYMLENRIIKDKISKNIKNFYVKTEVVDNSKKDDKKIELNDLDDELNYYSLVDEKDRNREDDFDKRIRKITKQAKDEMTDFKGEEKNNKNDQKRIVSMLVSMCGIMFLICFVLGTTLIRNEDRITGLEKEIELLVGAYNNVSESLQNPKEAFASQKNSNKKASNKVIKENGNKVVNENKLDNVNDVQNSKVIEDQKNKITKENDKNKKDNDKNKKDNDTSIKEDSKEEMKEKKSDIQEEIKEKKEEIKEKKDENLKENKEQANEKKEIILNKNANIPTTYKVQTGDSLLKISQRFYGSKSMVKKIMKENNITDPNKIFYGKILKLPRE